MMKLKDVVLKDRPRERLKTLGVNALTDAELLAIILGSGSKDKNVLELANHILHIYPLNILANLDLITLEEIEGIKIAKASKLVALFELARRANMSFHMPSFNNSSDIYEYLKPDYLFLNYEQTTILLLTANCKLIKKLTLSLSSSNLVFLDFNYLLENLIKYKASNFILVHNHPSGDATPSKEDINVTLEIRELAFKFSYRLLDHIIITQTNYFSFKDNELI